MTPIPTDPRLGVLRTLVAIELLSAGAFRTSFEQPFRLASGNFSPIYVNCRLLISRRAFGDLFCAAAKILTESRSIAFDVIAGGETAGIPFAAILARSFDKPLAYVRKSQKSHGLSGLIEGDVPKHSRVLLVEDLITDAGSKLRFINAIRDAGGQISDVLVVLDRLQGGVEALAEVDVLLHALTDINTVRHEALALGFISPDENSALQLYFHSPSAWHAERGLAFNP